jgi:hypothetical protein
VETPNGKRRQIAANRKTRARAADLGRAGKRRSSGNAFRHGLGRVINERGREDIEALAHLLVGDHADQESLEQARMPFVLTSICFVSVRSSAT